VTEVILRALNVANLNVLVTKAKATATSTGIAKETLCVEATIVILTRISIVVKNLKFYELLKLKYIRTLFSINFMIRNLKLLYGNHYSKITAFFAN